MEYQTIIEERRSAVTRLITNRPRYKNAQSRQMIFDSYLKERLEGKGFPKVMPGVTRALKPK